MKRSSGLKIFTMHMQYWLDFIEDAQQPILMSSRDGKLLKPVPLASRLSSGRLQYFLEQAMGRPHMAVEARRMLCDCWCGGEDLRRSFPMHYQLPATSCRMRDLSGADAQRT